MGCVSIKLLNFCDNLTSFLSILMTLLKLKLSNINYHYTNHANAGRGKLMGIHKYPRRNRRSTLSHGLSASVYPRTIMYLLNGSWWVLDSLLSLLWKLDESGTSLPGTSVMLGKGFWLGLTQSEQSQWYPKSIADNDCTPTRYMRCDIGLCGEVKGRDSARANNSTRLR